MQNFLILGELQTEFLKFKIHFAKISYKEFLIKKTECIVLQIHNSHVMFINTKYLRIRLRHY